MYNYSFYNLYNDGMPMGFGVALAANPIAYERFSNLSEKERAELLARTHGIESKEEMRAFVEKFGAGALE